MWHRSKSSGCDVALLSTELELEIDRSPTPIPPEIWGCFPWTLDQITDVRNPRNEDPTLIISETTFEEIKPI